MTMQVRDQVTFHDGSGRRLTGTVVAMATTADDAGPYVDVDVNGRRWRVYGVHQVRPAS